MSNRTIESQAGWRALQQRILTRPEPTIRLQYDAEQNSEFAGIKLKAFGQDMIVTDRDRLKKHRDITESLAMCCHLVSLEVMSGGGLQLSTTRGRQVTNQKTLASLRSSGSMGFKPTRGIDTNKL